MTDLSIKQGNTLVEFLKKNNSYRITHEGFVWKNRGRKAHIMIRR